MNVLGQSFKRLASFKVASSHKCSQIRFTNTCLQFTLTGKHKPIGFYCATSDFEIEV